MIKLKDLLMEGPMRTARRDLMIRRINKIGWVFYKKKKYQASVASAERYIDLVSNEGRKTQVHIVDITNWEIMHPPGQSLVKIW